VAITFFFGVLLTAQYYVPHPSSEALLSELSVWNQIIAGFALILGAASLLQTHTVKIRRQEAGWGYSAVMYISMFVMLGAGVWSQGKTEGTAFGWLYDYVMVALQGTMFSLLAFFIASAAYRAFRARTTESAILLLAAVLVMFGRVPFGEYLISGVGQLSDWVMSVPNTAAQRGILIGVSLGGIATSIKIICGIERSYLGEGKD
jgi:hypothetical protein